MPRYTDIIFPSYDVRFIAVNDGVDSERGDSEGMAAIRNLFNEWYPRDTSISCYFIYGVLSPFETTRTWLYLESQKIDDSIGGVFILFCYFIKLPYILPNMIAYRAINKVVSCSLQKSQHWNILSVFLGLFLFLSSGIFVLSWIHIIGCFFFWKDSNPIELNLTIHLIICILLVTMTLTQIPYTLYRLHKEKLKR